MSRQIELWKIEHRNFSRLLDVLEAQLRLFHRGSGPDYDLMLHVVYYMTHYPDRFHHPKEDIAFRRLADKDERLRAAVDELLRQHAIIAESGKQLQGRLEAVVGGAMMPREDVEAPAHTYIAEYRKHLQREEAELFPLALQGLVDEDWATIDSTAARGADPLFGDRVEQRYASIHRQIAAAAGCGCTTVSSTGAA
jgi:hemerythrin-like domain-containing protein